MPPKKHTKVDYLRVYPGLNDFSDALEAIPLEMVAFFTELKEIEKKTSDIYPELGGNIDGYFKQREPGKLRDISSKLLDLMPAIEQKMHVAAMASEAMTRQTERLMIDYQMACEHEIPQEIQLDPSDPAFMQIVPPEKQATARSQARREAREAREARRVAQQESRAGTPVSGSAEPNPNLAVPHFSSRRRERTATPQSPQPSAFAAPALHAVASASPAIQAVQPLGLVDPQSAPRADGRQSRRHATEEPVEEDNDGVAESEGLDAKSEDNISVPPVVMPISVDSVVMAKKNVDLAADIDSVAAEAVTGLKRKRGIFPKDRNEPIYCYCNQASYGEMVACDGPNCTREWFHLGCLGLSALPKGQWFCEECQAKFRRR